MLSCSRIPGVPVAPSPETMQYLGLFLMCLLSCEAAYFRKYKRGNRYSVREATNDGGGSDSGGGGYHYQAPSSNSGGSGGISNDVYTPHEDLTMATFVGSGNSGSSSVGGGSTSSSGASAGSSDGGYQYNAPLPTAGGASASLSESPVDIQSLSGVVESTIASSGGGAGTSSLTSGLSGGSTLGGGSGFDFGGQFGSSGSLASFGIGDGGRTSGSSDQFTAVQGEVISDHPPSIFTYKPEFGGKDINNLPHILPPGGKSIHELQDEADAKLRAIVAKAKMNQQEVLERITRLRGNYGYGTLGYDGFQDTRFKKKENFDLGTHKAIDLGTSIDYNALKAADGKLKLPIQNVYHTKTLGIHIPQPYPVKHEVAVPAPFPVPHPIPVPQHHPTPYSPLSHEELHQLSHNEERGSPFANSYGSGTSGANFGSGTSGANFGSGTFGANFGSFGGGFDFGGNSGNTFKGVSTGSFSIEPSQSISETSSVGGSEYGAGTPNAAGSGGVGGSQVEFSSQEQDHSAAFGGGGGHGGGSSVSFGTFGGSVQNQGHVAPTASSGGSHEQSISSEAGSVSIPSMNFGERTRPRPDYGPPPSG